MPSAVPHKIETDWIGPPDKDSNLRHFKFHIPADESSLERDYRLQREKVLKWNHEYWSKHNRSFSREKQEFVTKKLAELGRKNPDGTLRQLSAEEMSEFYRKFLNDNYKAHKDYNREWYKANARLLLPAFKVAVQKLFSKKYTS